MRCVFCAIGAGQAPVVVVREWPDALAIVPHHPVVPGHVLVIPRTHVADFAENPDVTAATMRAAAELGAPPANIITSAGSAATQTVFHLHVHVVPRADGDGLALPWTGQHDEHTLAGVLRDTVRDLSRHVAERAEEIAAPRIAAAECDRDDTVASLARAHAAERQRLEDVIKELRRMVDARDTQLDRACRTMREHGINPLTGLKEA